MNLLKAIFNAIFSIFKKSNNPKLVKVAEILEKIRPIAEEVVRILATLTGNKTIIDILNIIDQLSVPQSVVTIDTSRVYTKAEIDGLIVGIGNYLVREKLAEKQTVVSSEPIPDNIINTALNTAYTVYKTVGE